MKHVYFYDTPVEPLRVMDNGSAIIEITFSTEDKVLPRKAVEEETPLIAKAAAQLTEYFDGSRREFDFPTEVGGTEFQRRVWQELCRIPYGQTRTYKQVAEAIGCPKGFRAIGMANNRNPIAIVVPCHRVVGSGGRLVGYAGGLAVKEKLLQLERAFVEGAEAEVTKNEL